MFKQFFCCFFYILYLLSSFRQKVFLRKLSLKIYEPKLAWHTSVIKFFSANVLSRKEGKNQFDTKQAFMHAAGVWTSSCRNPPERLAILLW